MPKSAPFFVESTKAKKTVMNYNTVIISFKGKDSKDNIMQVLRRNYLSGKGPVISTIRFLVCFIVHSQYIPIHSRNFWYWCDDGKDIADQFWNLFLCSKHRGVDKLTTHHMGSWHLDSCRLSLLPTPYQLVAYSSCQTHCALTVWHSFLYLAHTGKWMQNGPWPFFLLRAIEKQGPRTVQ